MLVQRTVAAGTKVKMATPMSVPAWSTWDDDGHRTSNAVKKRLQEQFFKGDKRIAAEVLYISRESERDKLRMQGRCKVQIRDAAGSVIVITADSASLKAV